MTHHYSGKAASFRFRTNNSFSHIAGCIGRWEMTPASLCSEAFQTNITILHSLKGFIVLYRKILDWTTCAYRIIPITARGLVQDLRCPCHVFNKACSGHKKQAKPEVSTSQHHSSLWRKQRNKSWIFSSHYMLSGCLQGKGRVMASNSYCIHDLSDVEIWCVGGSLINS